MSFRRKNYREYFQILKFSSIFNNQTSLKKRKNIIIEGKRARKKASKTARKRERKYEDMKKMWEDVKICRYEDVKMRRRCEDV